MQSPSASLQVTRPERPTKWKPLLVIGNSKSGNNDGSAFLNSFRGQLNPLQGRDAKHISVHSFVHMKSQMLTPMREVIVPDNESRTNIVCVEHGERRKMF